MTTVHDGLPRLLDAIVELAGGLARGSEIGGFLHLLVHRSADLLSADTAGVMLEFTGGPPAVVAATSEEMLAIAELGLQLEQGPSVDAFRTGRRVVIDDVDRHRERWPDVVPRIVGVGMRSVCALPLQLRDLRIGALTLYRRDATAFDASQIRLGQALADIAAVGILRERVTFQAEHRAGQLQRALDSRVVIEQAKGMLAERHGVPLPDAFEMLRRHARTRGIKLRDVCRDLVSGDLDL